MKQTYAILLRPTSSISKGGIETDYLTDDAEPLFTRLDYDELDDRAAAELLRSEDVQAMAPVMDISLIHPADGPRAAGTVGWAISAVGADATKSTGKGVTAALLDTGIEASHPCFKGVVIKQRDFSGDGDGDRRGHGTHCAAVLLGRNVGGVRYGVAPEIEKAYVGKVVRDDGTGSTQMIFDGLKWAIDEKVDVISMSVGIDYPGRINAYTDEGLPSDIAASRALDDYRRTVTFFDQLMGLATAAGRFGQTSLVFAASGNQSRRQEDPRHVVYTTVPAVSADVSVGAIARLGERLAVANFSNARPTLVAPGVDVESAWLNGGFRSMSGTSIACPLAAGVGALWLQYLRQQGENPARDVLRSHLIAAARRDVFGGSFTSADLGSGLVSAPP
jgi:subtilisin family serine protease